MSEHEASGSGTRASHRTPVVAAVMIAAIAVAVAGGLFAGARLASGPRTVPGDGSIDAGFARDMQTHHRQAVQMSAFVLDRTDDPEVRTLARDIQLTQQQQAGQMYACLEQWNLPQSSTRPVMAWMPDGAAGMSGMQHGQDGSPPGDGQEGDPAGMPGMAGPDELQRLRSASGIEAERLYLQLMIPHHQGALAMAGLAARQASDPDVRRLAQTILDSQTAELTVLREMLAARGGAMGGP